MARITLEQLGTLIKERRASRGLREVAREIGISAATLSRVEAGKQPDLDSFKKICTWLEVDPGELLGHKGPGRLATIGATFESSAHFFKAGQTLSPKTAKHLGELIYAIHNAAVAKQAELE